MIPCGPKFSRERGLETLLLHVLPPVQKQDRQVVIDCAIFIGERPDLDSRLSNHDPAYLATATDLLVISHRPRCSDQS